VNQENGQPITFDFYSTRGKKNRAKATETGTETSEWIKIYGLPEQYTVSDIENFVGEGFSIKNMILPEDINGVLIQEAFIQFENKDIAAAFEDDKHGETLKDCTILVEKYNYMQMGKELLIAVSNPKRAKSLGTIKKPDPKIAAPRKRTKKVDPPVTTEWQTTSNEQSSWSSKMSKKSSNAWVSKYQSANEGSWQSQLKNINRNEDQKQNQMQRHMMQQSQQNQMQQQMMQMHQSQQNMMSMNMGMQMQMNMMNPNNPMPEPRFMNQVMQMQNQQNLQMQNQQNLFMQNQQNLQMQNRWNVLPQKNPVQTSNSTWNVLPSKPSPPKKSKQEWNVLNSVNNSLQSNGKTNNWGWSTQLNNKPAQKPKPAPVVQKPAKKASGNFEAPGADCPFKHLVQMGDVPPGTTKKDIKLYFQPHAPIAVLMKPNGFVDTAFKTHHDAQKAMAIAGKEMNRAYPVLKLTSQGPSFSNDVW